MVQFQESERVVSSEEGVSLAKELGCLFLECSAKTRENVENCFEELALKVRKEMQKMLYLNFYYTADDDESVHFPDYGSA